jgi:hypothetical protein
MKILPFLLLCLLSFSHQTCQETNDFLDFSIFSTQPGNYKNEHLSKLSNFYATIATTSSEKFKTKFFEETLSFNCKLNETKINQLFFFLKSIHQTLGIPKVVKEPIDVLIVGKIFF